MMIADGLGSPSRNRKFDPAPIGRAASGVAFSKGSCGFPHPKREANPSVVYVAYLRRRSIRPLNRRVRLMEFAVQGNNFLGRGIRSRSMPFAAVRVSLTPAEIRYISSPRKNRGFTVTVAISESPGQFYDGKYLVPKSIHNFEQKSFAYSIPFLPIEKQ